MTGDLDSTQALDQLAALACTGQPGSDALASRVLELLAAALDADGIVVGKLQSDWFIVEWLHERTGTGLHRGDNFILHDQSFRDLDQPASPDGPDAGTESYYRSLLLAGRDGVRACTGITLYRMDGSRYGRLCVVRSDARPPTTRELTLLRLGGRIVMSVIEAHESRLVADALQHQVLHDPLTGLPNRLLVRDRLERALLTSQRSGTPMSVLIMDLDGFKNVNDTLGHYSGDMLLCEVAARVKRVLRESDTFARVGGDEFVIILPGATAQNAAIVARKILNSLARPFILDGQQATIWASIGIAEHPDHGLEARTLLEAADTAMYAAKRRRGGFDIHRTDTDPIAPNLLRT